MSAENRKSQRINISEEYFFYPQKEKKKINCKINNISVTGACITSDEKIENDEVIFLHIRGTNNMALKSKTVWKINNQYGLQFFLDTNSEFEKISYIMNNLIKLNTE